MRMTSASQKSQGVLGLQTGWNKGASQSGMSFGGIRHICEVKVGKEKDKEGKVDEEKDTEGKVDGEKDAS